MKGICKECGNDELMPGYEICEECYDHLVDCEVMRQCDRNCEIALEVNAGIREY